MIACGGEDPLPLSAVSSAPLRRCMRYSLEANSYLVPLYSDVGLHKHRAGTLRRYSSNNSHPDYPKQLAFGFRAPGLLYVGPKQAEPRCRTQSQRPRNLTDGLAANTSELMALFDSHNASSASDRDSSLPALEILHCQYRSATWSRVRESIFLAQPS